MDSTFIPVTITFFTFIIIAYYLNVLRFSIPLVMIYFIYCFGYFIKNDNLVSTDEKIIITAKENNKKNIKTLALYCFKTLEKFKNYKNFEILAGHFEFPYPNI